MHRPTAAPANPPPLQSRYLRMRQLRNAYLHYFPWFRDAAVGKILRVELPSPDHLYWPELDVDLAVESIRRPERFPLASQAGV